MVISLTTDFGDGDGYVGTMKGVMARIAPGVPFVDITHAIEPQAVAEAAYVLWTSLPYFPPDSVHLAVVDPGVGTARRAIASLTEWGVLVGPDNGVFTYVWAAATPRLTVALENPAFRLSEVSATFHGRDVFAPAAAHIAAGVPLEAFGPAVADPVRLPVPRLDVVAGGLRGAVLAIDRFGNAITSIGRLIWAGPRLRLAPAFGQALSATLDVDAATVMAGTRVLGPVRRTYDEVRAGQALAIIGSAGMLEIAVNRGHAAQELGLGIGDTVSLVG
ncbi:MAG: SAM-dependent chlorinase/fluorinase [Anaerolineae bacterium]|nr:SAM-dependent chlorinase/fluorinase [Anaerolineae bacterium]